MLFRSLPDLPAPTDADFDTAATSAAEALVERGERQLRILARLTDIAMNLAEALGRQAQARIEAATTATTEADSPPPPLEDPTIAFNRMAQTVRRCVALEARLAAGVKAGRDSLFADRAVRRAASTQAHEKAKLEAIIDGLHDAWAVDCPQTLYEEQVERLMEDAQEHFLDADEFRGWLDRPVGESVAKLCAAVGVDPAACTLDGETWTVRRPPTAFERTIAELYPPILPSPSGEGGFELIEKTGGEPRSCSDPP